MSRRLRSITTNRDMGKIMRLSQNGHKGGLVGRRRGDEAITPTSTKEMVTATGLSSQTEMQALVDPDPMVVPQFAIRVLNHLTYGATSSDVAAFRGLGSSDVVRLTKFVDQQLNPSTISDEKVDTVLAATNADGTRNYDALFMTLAEQWEKYRINNNINTRYGESPATQTQLAAFVRAVYTKRQVYEKVVAFWHDHFNVYYKEGGAASAFASYTNDVIRPNALGNFRLLLGAVTKSAAMMFYLDNRENNKVAPNENFARELLELHTLGAERYFGNKSQSEVLPDPEDGRFPSGYVEEDVLAAAKALTGWTVRAQTTAAFHFSSANHDVTEKKILGQTLAKDRGLVDGEDLLDIVAQHPGTARFVCTKLIRFFVTDAPSVALVDSASKIFRDNWLQPDQIKITLRHILLSTDLQSSWQQKVRRPGEVAIAAFRAVGTEWQPKWTLPIPAQEDATPETALMARLSRTGHGTYEWTPPNGYPDVQRPWLATNSMAALWRLLSWLPKHTAIPGDESTAVLPILSVSRAEVPTWTAGALVNFWCRRLLGYLPKESHRQVLVGFLLQNGDRATFVIPDTNVDSATDLKNHRCQDRIKAMVSMILMSPEFMSR